MAKSKLKFTFITVLTVISLLLAVFFTGRYGWRLFGFAFCESAVVESVEVREGSVRIRGSSARFVPDGFIGYKARIEGDALYVGVNFSGVFGFFETGDFDIEIETETQVRRVYLVTSDGERPIYEN